MHLRGFLFTLTTACLFGLGIVLAKPIGEAFQPFFASWLALLGAACASAPASCFGASRWSRV